MSAEKEKENKLVDFNDVGMIHKKPVIELIEALQLLLLKGLTDTQEITKELENISNEAKINKNDLEKIIVSFDSYYRKIVEIQKSIDENSILVKHEKLVSKLEKIFDEGVKKLSIKNDDFLLNYAEDLGKGFKELKELNTYTNAVNFSKHAFYFKQTANDLVKEINNANAVLEKIEKEN